METPASLDAWMHLLVILVTVVPFYHGASRYLDAAYVTGERTSVKYALLLDFVFLFIESIIFFTLATLILDSRKSYFCFTFLLLFDIIWVGTTVLTTSTPSSSRGIVPGIGKWAILNIITIVIVLLLYWSTFNTLTIWRVTFAPSVLLAIIATVRSVLDYYLVWEFYYPREMLRANPHK